MTPRLSGHFPIFGLVFFILNSLMGIARQQSREKICNFDPKASESCLNSGARFSKVPIINGTGKPSPFILKIEVSKVLHLA